MKPIAESIAEHEEAREKKAKRSEAILRKASDEGRSLTATEQEELDTLSDEIDMIDEDLKRFKRLQAQLSRSTPVRAEEAESPESAARLRGPVERIEVRPNVEKGVAFARYVGALVRSRFNLLEASEFAKRWNDTTPEVSLVLKAAVNAGSTTDGNFATKLVEYQTITSEFLELLRPMTVLGRFGTDGIPALRSMPFNVRMALQTGGGVHAWVGEGARKPVGDLQISEVLLRFSKVSGIIVVTDELMRFSAPNVEMIIRDDLLRGSAAFTDRSFVDPMQGPASNAAPAAITYGVQGVAATGTTADALRADLATMWTAMWNANLPIGSGVFIMSNRVAQRLSLMRTPLGVREFPDITPTGGMLEGFPVIASESVETTSDGDVIIFVLANQVLLADDGAITIDASREASLQLASDPEGADTSAALVSLWQRNLVALRAERFIRWQKARDGVVGVITGAENYTGSVSSS